MLVVRYKILGRDIHVYCSRITGVLKKCEYSTTSFLYCDVLILLLIL